MSMMTVLWIVWAVITASLLVLLLYRGTLTRYEEDQIYLDDAGGHQEREQQALLNRVSKIQPMVRVVMGATGLMSAAIIGIYVWDMIRQF